MNKKGIEGIGKALLFCGIIIIIFLIVFNFDNIFGFDEKIDICMRGYIIDVNGNSYALAGEFNYTRYIEQAKIGNEKFICTIWIKKDRCQLRFDKEGIILLLVSEVDSWEEGCICTEKEEINTDTRLDPKLEWLKQHCTQDLSNFYEWENKTENELLSKGLFPMNRLMEIYGDSGLWNCIFDYEDYDDRSNYNLIGLGENKTICTEVVARSN
ncbi:MAG: hypothetical protein AABW56_01475 [Nanoarchaeota archaeon]